MTDIIKQHNHDLLKLVAEDFYADSNDTIEEEIKKDSANPKYAITETEYAMFNNLMSKEKAASKAINFRRKSFKKIALLVAIVTLLIISALSVGAVKTAINNFFEEISDGYTSLKGNEDFRGLYLPAKTPEGYAIESIDNNSNPRKTTYTDGKNYLYFYEYYDGSQPKKISGLEIKFNGYDAIQSEAEIMWDIGDNTYLITSTDSNFDLLNLASTIVKNNE